MTCKSQQLQQISIPSQSYRMIGGTGWTSGTVIATEPNHPVVHCEWKRKYHHQAYIDYTDPLCVKTCSYPMTLSDCTCLQTNKNQPIQRHSTLRTAYPIGWEWDTQLQLFVYPSIHDIIQTKYPDVWKRWIQESYQREDESYQREDTRIVINVKKNVKRFKYKK